MSFFKKLFGKKDQQQESKNSEENLPWIEPTENP